ncbi:MAG: NYN domain-containing protein [Oscillospiraceae bacterium]|nr:NYN domain-containing protein [Oscillospiraceae bacterium]
MFTATHERKIAYTTDSVPLPNEPIISQAGPSPLLNTGNTFAIVSAVAYLTGVPKRIFENDSEPPKIEVYQKHEFNKNARIIRNLCTLRTAIERSFGKIVRVMKEEHKNWCAVNEYIPVECISKLSDDGINLKTSLKLTLCVIEINKIIADKINNCKDMFPSWLNWEYLKDLFIMPNGYTEAGIKQAGDVYYQGFQFYPYQIYINWKPTNSGNIFYTDRKFVELLYRLNSDDFTDISKVTDISGRTKDAIYEFIERSTNTVFVVDCENSDPYKLFAAFRALDNEYLHKISKIILYDDVNTIATWQSLEGFVNIPVEYIQVERLKVNKSQIDMKLALGVSKEFYQNKTDSFILASSDSDYWSLITSLDDANFLVMIEYEKTSPTLKQVLQDENIFYCYLDKFYTGDSDDMKIPMLLKAAQNYINARVSLNVREMMEHAFFQTRIEMSDLERKRFCDKYVKSLELKIDDDDNLLVQFKRKGI